MRFYPYKMGGGGGKSFGHAEAGGGGQKQFWGSFYVIA